MRWIAFLALVTAMIGCGGGGSSQPATSVRVIEPAKSATTNFDLDDQPILELLFEVLNAPTAGLAFEISSEGAAIEDVDIIQRSDTTGALVLFLEQGTDIPPSVYNQSVQVRICIDDACAQQVSGSPLNFQLTYDVRGPSNLVAATITPTPRSEGLLSDPVGPIADVTIDVSNPPAEMFFVQRSNYQFGSSLVESATVSGTGATRTISFQLVPPSTAGEGVKLVSGFARACFDANCQRLIPNTAATPNDRLSFGFEYLVTEFRVLPVSELRLYAGDILWDPVSARILYAESFGDLAKDASSLFDVGALEPVSGQVTPITSFPGGQWRIALSPDSKNLFVSATNGPFVRQISLADFSLVGSINLGNNFGRNYTAREIAVSPFPSSELLVGVATDRQRTAFSFRLFDGLVQRADTVDSLRINFSDLKSGVWGNDANTLYALRQNVTGPILLKLGIFPSGLSIVEDMGPSVASPQADIKYHDEKLFFTTGEVFDLSSRAVTATLGEGDVFPNDLVIDPNLGRVFFVHDYVDDPNGMMRITSYDLQTFEEIETILVEVSSSQKIIRWGDRGLALLDRGRDLYLLENSFVDGSP